MPGRILINCILRKFIFFFVPLISLGQNKGLLFDDLAFKQNVRKQYIGPAFQDETLPNKVSLRKYCPIPGNQGNMGSCVGWSVGYGAYTISDAIRKSITEQNEITSLAFSPLYLYNQVKISDCRNGAYIHNALTFSKQKGDCLLSLFNPQNCFIQPPDPIQTTKIIDFQALFYGNESKQVRLYAVKQKLKDRLPVIIGFETNNLFSSQLITKENPVWVSGGRNDGGHAVVIVGYDDDKQMFEVLNSWGNHFGENGFFWMRYNDFLVYTHYAAVLILPEIQKDNVVKFEGSANLRYFDKNLKRLEDVNVIKTDRYTYRTAKSNWSLSDIFQLRINNKSKNQYIYVFSIDKSNKATIHFPRRKEFGNINSNDLINTNESEFFTAEKVALYIPNEKTGMQLNSSEDVLCVLYSKSEIRNFAQVVYTIAQYYTERQNLSSALDRALPTRLMPINNISYSNNNSSFESTGKVHDIVPIIMQIKANPN